MTNPIQQGLKREEVNRASVVIGGVAMTNPIQQGLKQETRKQQVRFNAASQ